MISIREIAPGAFLIVCPQRGTYRTGFFSHREAKRHIWTAASAPASDWINNAQRDAGLTRLGLQAATPTVALDL